MLRSIAGSFLTVALLSLSPTWAEAQERCRPIQFAQNQSSAEIRGTAPAEGGVCYTLATGEGQTARVRVLSGKNIIFNIEGVTDPRDDFEFRTQRKTYRINVAQLMRSVTPEAFKVSVSVR